MSEMTFSINLIADLQEIFRYQFMQHAVEAGTVVAIVAGIVGYFVVLRRSSFAAHALSHVGFAGAAGAVLFAVSPVYGLLLFTGVGGSAMAVLSPRAANRDVHIGTVLAFLLGIVFMLLVAVATSIAVQVVGVLLIFSLMVTPAAIAQQLAKRPQTAMIVSVTIALVATWLGLFVAYYEPYPVSFFITTIVFSFYLLVRFVYRKIKPLRMYRTTFEDTQS